jgi:rhamnulokinase
MSGAVAAIDLGATSGRVMVGHVGAGTVSIRSVARFPNVPVQTNDGLHWDIRDLYANVLAGLRTALHDEPNLRSIAVDSWAVDYALLNKGTMIGTPFHYRDDRTGEAVEQVRSRIGDPALYAANGLQFLPFNTLYQLTADDRAGVLSTADAFLLIPDLFNFWFTGKQFAEVTNASTTGLLGIRSREWDSALIEKLDLPRAIFPSLIGSGIGVGGFLPEIVSELGGGSRVEVTTVGSHDTASAVVAVPATREDFAYISCGTWGLVGVELDGPVLSEESRLANFTNEGGVDGRIRYLHNVMGLWLLNESVKAWERDATKVDLEALIEAAAQLPASPSVFDANDQRFLTPGDMPSRIAEWCGEHNMQVPQSRAEFVRSIIESLAVAFADAVTTARALSGTAVSVIHIVGGGSQNALLCQLTADRSGLPVLAGPVEATAIGNLLIQARANGLVSGSLESLRSIVAATFPPLNYIPRAGSQA